VTREAWRDACPTDAFEFTFEFEVAFEVAFAFAFAFAFRRYPFSAPLIPAT
jgi:hypothetical protein